MTAEPPRGVARLRFSFVRGAFGWGATAGSARTMSFNIETSYRRSLLFIFVLNRVFLSPPLFFFFTPQDPAGIFELVEVVGNGTYGQVYKVCRRLKHGLALSL